MVVGVMVEEVQTDDRRLVVASPVINPMLLAIGVTDIAGLAELVMAWPPMRRLLHIGFGLRAARRLGPPWRRQSRLTNSISFLLNVVLVHPAFACRSATPESVALVFRNELGRGRMLFPREQHRPPHRFTGGPTPPLYFPPRLFWD